MSKTIRFSTFLKWKNVQISVSLGEQEARILLDQEDLAEQLTCLRAITSNVSVIIPQGLTTQLAQVEVNELEFKSVEVRGVSLLDEETSLRLLKCRLTESTLIQLARVRHKEVLRRLNQPNYSANVLAGLARNVNTAVDVLEGLVRVPACRLALAINVNTPLKVLEELWEQPCAQLLSNPSFERVHQILKDYQEGIVDLEESVIVGFFYNKSLSWEELVGLLSRVPPVCIETALWLFRRRKTFHKVIQTLLLLRKEESVQMALLACELEEEELRLLTQSPHVLVKAKASQKLKDWTREQLVSS